MRNLLYLSVLILIISGCSAKQVVIEGTPRMGAAIVVRDEEKRIAQEEITPVRTPKTEPVTPKIAEEKKEEVAPTSSLESQDPEEEETNIRSVLEEDISQKFDIPVVFNDAVRYFINYFTTEKRKVFANWLKRSEKYVPMMREILREEGLPEDLVYLAMIESGFNPKAYSPAKASGPWQFIYSTGKRYGLRVDYWVDERRDPEKSTVAAARYLKDLFNQFGCWYLAAASYNVGEKKVEKVLERHNSRDIWELIKYNTLPKETREYIPKLLAAAIIAKNPEDFGFERVRYENPIRFLKLKIPRATPLKKIAEAADLSLEVVRSLNPEVLRGITPPDREFVLKLPSWVNRETFSERLSEMVSSQKKLKSFFAYRVKKTDTVNRILKKYGISRETLCLWNSDSEKISLKPGQIIYIPKFRVDRETKIGRSNNQQGKFAAHREKIKSPDRSRQSVLYHRVKKGDTLFSISKRYGVDIQSIMSLNNLKNERIRPGMTLKIPLEKGKTPT